MASGDCKSDSEEEMEEFSDVERKEYYMYLENLALQNRFKQRDHGAEERVGFEMVSRKRKKKKKSNGSADEFASMKTDDKLICIFEQLNRNYEKMVELEIKQLECKQEIQKVNKGYAELDTSVSKLEENCNEQMMNAKVLSYKSIDNEARSMRNNLVIYGLTEKLSRNNTSLVFIFLENELHIDTREMKIERAHRFGGLSAEKYRGKHDPKRPMVVHFLDSMDTERIMSKAYKLKGSGFGIYRQYPKEIWVARSKLYNCEEAKDARMRRQKVQIRYPARLFIDGKCVGDMLPEWFKILNTDRIKPVQESIQTIDTSKNYSRRYLDAILIDEEERSSDSSDDVFETRKRRERERRNAHQNVNKISCDQNTHVIVHGSSAGLTQVKNTINKLTVSSDESVSEDVMNSVGEHSKQNKSEERTNTNQGQQKKGAEIRSSLKGVDLKQPENHRESCSQQEGGIENQFAKGMSQKNSANEREEGSINK